MHAESDISNILFREECPCAYFEDGRLSAIEYVLPDGAQEENYHLFLARGYRRLGRIFYHNSCGECYSCKPLRIEVPRFRLSKSQKRTLRYNEDLRIRISTRSHITADKVALYGKYIREKHGGSGMSDTQNPLAVLSAIHHGYANSLEMSYFKGEQLIAVGIVDEAEDALSSNYSYYDTDYLHRRPGIFSILKEISLAHLLGKKYYYLGFYIGENEKMSYKSSFRPNEILEESGWREFMKT